MSRLEYIGVQLPVQHEPCHRCVFAHVGLADILFINK